jgi:hypothetical protein
LSQSKQYTKLLMFFLIIGCLTACSNSKTIETSSKDGDSTIKINEKDESFKVESKNEEGKTNSSEFSNGKAIPDDFPKHIPFPDNAMITASLKSNINGQTSITVTFSAETKIEDFHKLYSAYMKEKKYSEVSDMLLGDSLMITGHLDGYVFSLLALRENESDASIDTTISWIQDAVK